MFSRTFYALAAASVMPLLGPRPLFVRTAYAAASTPIEEVVMYDIDADSGEAVKYDCSFATIDCEGLVFTTPNCDAFGATVVEACD